MVFEPEVTFFLDTRVFLESLHESIYFHRNSIKPFFVCLFFAYGGLL